MNDLATIRRLTAHLHASLRYQRVFAWQLLNLEDGEQGNCTSFARTLGERLIHAGLDPHRLSVVDFTEAPYLLGQGERHAVLRIEMPNGELPIYADAVRNRVGTELGNYVTARTAPRMIRPTGWPGREVLSDSD